MEQAMMALIAAAGVTVSVAIALLVEELVMGGMFRLMFVRAQAQIAEQRREEEQYVAH